MSEASSCHPKHCDKRRAARCAPTERCRKRLLSKGSTECRTQQPMFLVLFSKKYREKELKKNTSEQLRLGTAVEFNDERKRVFGWRGLSNSLRYARPSLRKRGSFLRVFAHSKQNVGAGSARPDNHETKNVGTRPQL